METEAVKMAPDIAPEIKEAADAVVKVSQPNVFASAMAIIMMLILSLLLYAFRLDWREERQASTRAVREMTESIKDLDNDFRAAGIPRQSRAKPARYDDKADQ